MALKIGMKAAGPTNTIYIDWLSKQCVMPVLADGAITPGHCVQYDTDTDIVIGAASGTATTFLGIAGDNELYETTYGTQNAYNAAYAAGQVVPVIYAGLVRAISDGTTTAAYSQIVNTTAGQLTDGTTAGRVVGIAWTTESPAGAGGTFVLQLRGA